MNRKLCRLAVCAAVLIATSIAAAHADDALPSPAMMAPLKTLLAVANGADAAPVKSIFTDDAVIIDEMPPHRWNGANAGVGWLKALHAQFKAQKVTGVKGTLQSVSVFEHSDPHRAFIVVPGTWTGSQAGRRFVENGIWSFVVVQSGGAWKISADAWAVTDLKYL